MKKEHTQWKDLFIKDLDKEAEAVIHEIETDDALKHLDPPTGMLNKLMEKLHKPEELEKSRVGKNKKMYLLVALVAALSMGIETTYTEDVSIVTEIKEQLFGERNTFLVN